MKQRSMTLLQAQTQGVMSHEAPLWKTLVNRARPLVSMAHQNGLERAAWASLQEKTLSHSETARCAVLRITGSPRKNVVQNMTALCALYTQLALVIVVRVHCENSV
jgi:hypothetical protein